MNTNIEIIEKKELKENKIIILIIILLTLAILYSKYIKYNKIIDCYFPYLLIFFICVILIGIINLKKIKILKNDKLLKDELKNILVYSQKGYILTKNYIIPYFNRKKITKYSDIVLMYIKRGNFNGSLTKYLYLVTKNNNVYSFQIETTASCFGYNSEPKDFTDIILEKNKNVLVGNTEENRQIIFDKYGIKIK